MKKIIAGLIVVILLGVVIALILLYMQLGRVVKAGIETVGPRVTQSDVTVRDVDFRPLKGSLQLDGLVVGNPEGFTSESAFTVETVRIALDPKSVFGDKVDIQEVIVEAPEVTYEVGVGRTNIGTIQRNVQDFLEKISDGTAEPEPEPEPEAPVTEGKKVAIDHVLVQNGVMRVNSTILKDAEATLKLPKLELRDIGKEQPVTAVEAAVRILNQVLYQIIEVAVENKDILREQIEGIGDVLQERTEGLKKEADTIIKGVRGLLNKQE